MPRLPIIPTIVVVAAVATMIALGIWQLGRAEEKEALIAEYQAALSSDERLVRLPRNEHSGRWHLFRKIDVQCDQVIEWRTTAGRNSSNQSGFTHIARCVDNGVLAFDSPQPMFEIALGWSRSTQGTSHRAQFPLCHW